MFQRLKNILIGEPLTHDDSGDEHLLSKIQPWPCCRVMHFHLSPMVQSRSSWF